VLYPLYAAAISFSTSSSQTDALHHSRSCPFIHTACITEQVCEQVREKGLKIIQYVLKVAVLILAAVRRLCCFAVSLLAALVRPDCDPPLLIAGV